MASFRVSRRLPALAVLPVIVAGLMVSAMPAQAAQRSAVAGGDAAWTSRAASLGHAASGAAVKVQVYLAPRGGESALEAAVAAVSNPRSASYRHYLSAAQYRAAYEPTADEVATVSDWLRSSGLRVTGVAASRRYVSASGTVGAAERAFATNLGSYRHNGQLVTAPATAATVPSSVAGAVLGVTGLDTTSSTVRPSLTGPPAAFENARPCSQYYGQLVAQYQADLTTPLPKFQGSWRDYAVCGYVPQQLRSAYEGSTSLTGAGVIVAITDAYAAGTIVRDANTYATTNGDVALARGQFQQHLPASFSNQSLCNPQGWAGEETLDVEAVHGMAPNANIEYYGGTSCLDSDLLATLQRVVDDNTASIVTNSWGDLGESVSGGEVSAYAQVFHQAAMQGISMLFSSGDNGDEVAATGIRQADFPADNPTVTAVGGTSTGIGPSGGIDLQTGWGTDKYNLASDGQSWVPIAANPFLYGAGGGYSLVFNRPWYQDGVVPTGQAGRAVPDIAMDADPTTGMLIGETQAFPDGSVKFSEYRIGGTSLASPLFAGVVALATEHAGARLGFLNPAIYTRARNHAAGITDVLPVADANVRPDYINGVDPSSGIKYSVRTFDQDSSLTTNPGWDDVTGVGVPNSHFASSF